MADVEEAERSLPRGIALADAQSPSVRESTRGGSLRVVRPGAGIGDFNPSSFSLDWQISGSYLEPLLRPDPATLRPTLWLARRWEWQHGGKELALLVREGVRWHDGSTFTAADAAFSFEVYQSDLESAVAGWFALVESIDAVSEHEVIIRFADHDPNWLFNAATLPIVSRRQYDDFWNEQPASARTLSGFDWQASPPVGTGPWRIADWDDTTVQYRRFDQYWGRPAWLDELQVTVQPGASKRLEAWRDGASDLLWPVGLNQLDGVGDARGTLHVAPAASVMFAAFNFANPTQPAGSLWTDLRVRRAVSLAINRERYAREVFGGFARWDAAGTVTQPWANDRSLVSPPHNPTAASALLAEAGWIDYDGDGVREDATGWPLRPLAVLREDSRPELAAVLARVARDLAAVGMALTVEALPADEFDRRWIEERSFDLIAYAYHQLPGFTDFDLYGSAWDIRSNPAGWNPGGYRNAEADAAIESFLTAISVERQAVALRQLQRAVDDDLFGLWLGFPMDLILVAEGVEGFAPDMAWQTLRTWDLWRTAER